MVEAMIDRLGITRGLRNHGIPRESLEEPLPQRLRRFVPQNEYSPVHAGTISWTVRRKLAGMMETSLIDLVNPATEETFRTVEPTSEAELAAILEECGPRSKNGATCRSTRASRSAADSSMPSAPCEESVALDITRQMGKPLAQARREVDTMLDRAETMLRLAPAALQDDELPPKEGFRRFIRHEPLGIVLDIPAWNYPLLIAVNVVIPALLAGNAVLDQTRPPDTAVRRRLCRRLSENEPSAGPGRLHSRGP